jgi:hypothetical protein
MSRCSGRPDRDHRIAGALLDRGRRRVAPESCRGLLAWLVVAVPTATEPPKPPPVAVANFIARDRPDDAAKCLSLRRCREMLRLICRPTPPSSLTAAVLPASVVIVIGAQ